MAIRPHPSHKPLEHTELAIESKKSASHRPHDAALAYEMPRYSQKNLILKKAKNLAYRQKHIPLTQEEVLWVCLGEVLRRNGDAS